MHVDVLRTGSNQRIHSKVLITTIIMTEPITPSQISFGGVVRYSDEEGLLNAMSELKKMDASDSFQNQLVELGSENPMILFTSEVEDSDSQELVRISRNDESEDEEELVIYLNFPYRSVATFSASLNEILSTVERILVEHINISYNIDESFKSLSNISDIDEVLEHELEGVRIVEGEYSYIFQQTDEGTNIRASLKEDTEIGAEADEDFIQEEIEKSTAFVEEFSNE